MDTTDALLRGILATVGRTAFPPAALHKIVVPAAGSIKQVQAYNLCDGQTPQKDICKKLKLDAGNFSRTISRWIEAGVVIRVGPEDLPMHLYRLSAQDVEAGKKGG
jgi:hypothetical protein